MALNIWEKIYGIIGGALRIGFTGPTIMKNTSVNNQLDVRSNNGSGVAVVDVDKARVTTLEAVAADGKKTVVTMQDGASGDLTFKFPTTDGNSGDHLATDGAGNVYWSLPGASSQISANSYNLNYNTSSPLNLLDAAANTEVVQVIVNVTTAFNGTGPVPSVSVGIAGDISKFSAAADVDLTQVGCYIIDVQIEQVLAAQMIATFTAAGSGGTTGVAAIELYTTKEA